MLEKITYEELSSANSLEEILDSIFNLLIQEFNSPKMALFIFKPLGPLRQETVLGYTEEELQKIRLFTEEIYQSSEIKRIGDDIYIPLNGRLQSYGMIVMRLTPGMNGQQRLETYRKSLGVVLELFHIIDLLHLDPNTGLPDRKYVLSRLDEQIQRQIRYGEDFSLLIVEISDYHSVKDMHGLETAEKLMMDAGRLIKRIIRKSDILGRFDESKFIILMPHTTKEGASTFETRLRSTFEFETFNVGGTHLRLNIRTGFISSDMIKTRERDEIILKAFLTMENSNKKREKYKKLLETLDKEYRVEIIGNSDKIQKVKEAIIVAAQNDLPVLLLGETGTGKELTARKIHELSPRRDNPFVVIDCGAIPDSLLETELFGHEKGAFTGAISRKRGLFEVAHGGTIFLDEIEATSPQMQVRLLRAIEEKTIRRVGGTEPINIDVRIIAASNIDLEKEIETGRFRKDLFYRLAGIVIKLPPLRERKEDLPLLINHFIKRASLTMGKDIKGISKEVEDAFLSYDWPGNVRELEREIEKAVAFTEDGGTITLDHISDRIRSKTSQGFNLKSMVENYEKQIIIETLKNNNWNETRTAKLLGISRTTLLSKMKKYRIEKPHRFSY